MRSEVYADRVNCLGALRESQLGTVGDRYRSHIKPTTLALQASAQLGSLRALGCRQIDRLGSKDRLDPGRLRTVDVHPGSDSGGTQGEITWLK